MPFHSSIPADCPPSWNDYKNGSLFCNDSTQHPFIYGHPPAIASLISSSLSVIGSILTILPYVLWKDIRTGIRRIITFLALADFFTASGYILGNINYFIFQNNINNNKVTDACDRFDEFCQIQSYISSWSSYSSFWWTSILALYLYWTVVKGEIKKGDRYFPLYHVLSWGSPILVMFPLLATGSLGYSTVAAGGWCFIRDGADSTTLDVKTLLKILFGGKAFEILTYVWVVIVYGGIWCNIHRKKRKQSAASPISSGLNTLLKQVERKLYFIPFAFILVRMWGTVQFIFSIFVFNLGHVHMGAGKNTSCVSTSLFKIYYALAILQSIGDGAQGWVNSLLYIFWSPKIRQRLIIQPLAVLCYRIATHVSPTTNPLPHTLSPVPSDSPVSRKGYYGGVDVQHNDDGLQPNTKSTTHDTMLETLSREGAGSRRASSLIGSGLYDKSEAGEN